jgi:hypothetical protein
VDKAPQRLSPISRKRRDLLSAVFLFNFLAILCGSSLPRAQQNIAQQFFTPYLRWTRLLQSWPLFVPSPRQNAMKYHVEIQFQNGETKVWQRPYPPNWDFFARHLSYQFQKYDLAANYLDNKSPLWNDLALYIQNLCWNDTNPPVKITLIKSMAKWQPPNEEGWVGPDERLLQWSDRPLFVYNVQEKRIE